MLRQDICSNRPQLASAAIWPNKAINRANAKFLSPVPNHCVKNQRHPWKLHPPPYSYRRGSCFLYSSCSMPMPNQLQGETHTTHPVLQHCIPGCCRHMTTGLRTGWTWSYLPTCWSYSTASETHSRPPAETPSVCNVNKIHLILSQGRWKNITKLCLRSGEVGKYTVTW